MKKLLALYRDPGIRLGLAHIGDWPRQGSRTLEYQVLLASFTGDWYAAAEIYRQWALRQHWATPLQQRTDVPDWLLDSPPYITIRPQGIVDAGPTCPVDAFLPYEKCIPLLERIAQRVDSPLVAVMMGWEHGGSWVYPDCFPPIGGDESMARFTRMARERGWHVGSFCNGTRWVTAHAWNGYDGEPYYREHHGEHSVCRTPAGLPWQENLGSQLASQLCLLPGIAAHPRHRRRFRPAFTRLGLRIHPIFRSEYRRLHLPLLCRRPWACAGTGEVDGGTDGAHRRGVSRGSP